jgi:hypothetical protein
MENLKVKDNRSLVRQKASSAILTVDNQSLLRYREERSRANKLNNVHEENIKLKNELDEIKSLIQGLLTR